MNKAQARRSRKNEGKYRAQFARTEKNKNRRVANLMARFPKYRATLGLFKPEV